MKSCDWVTGQLDIGMANDDAFAVADGLHDRETLA
jgi:hypothetical protein